MPRVCGALKQGHHIALRARFRTPRGQRPSGSRPRAWPAIAKGGGASRLGPRRGARTLRQAPDGAHPKYMQLEHSLWAPRGRGLGARQGPQRGDSPRTHCVHGRQRGHAPMEVCPVSDHALSQLFQAGHTSCWETCAGLWRGANRGIIPPAPQMTILLQRIASIVNWVRYGVPTQLPWTPEHGESRPGML